MTDDLLEKILESPQLPKYAAQIQRRLEKERYKRLEFYNIIKESDKVEFINGRIIYQTPIRKQHGNASDNLMVLIKAYSDVKDLGYTGHEKYVITLTRNDYEPDICFWRKEKSDNFTDEQIQFPAPDFIVEILSKSTESRDRGIKMEDYAAHGVEEYWLVDPKHNTIEQYILDENQFSLLRKAKNDDVVKSQAIEGFEIPVIYIFDKKENISVLSALLKKS